MNARLWSSGVCHPGCLLLLLGASALGAVQGRVTLNGAPRDPDVPIRIASSDPACSHSGKLVTENWKIGDKNGLADTVVWVQDGPPGKPGAKAVVEQKGCRYAPHVLCIVKGTTVTFKNEDNTLHNVHGSEYRGKYEESVDLFNLGQIAGMATDQNFDQTGIFKIKCDVHPWMLGWILVTGTGYFAVTGPDGAFQFPPGLPDGSYRAQAWHSGFEKPLVQNFVVKDGNATLDLEFSAAQAD